MKKDPRVPRAGDRVTVEVSGEVIEVAVREGVPGVVVAVDESAGPLWVPLDRAAAPAWGHIKR